LTPFPYSFKIGDPNTWLSELLQLKDEVKISIKELGLVVKIED